jgi:hypothetical protein
LAAKLAPIGDQCLVVRLAGRLKAEFGGTAIAGEDVLRVNSPGK